MMMVIIMKNQSNGSVVSDDSSGDDGDSDDTFDEYHLDDFHDDDDLHCEIIYNISSFSPFQLSLLSWI